MAKERNYPLAYEILPNFVPAIYNKGAVRRLFERICHEKPEIRIVSRPTTHVPNGKNRLKFPDPKKDCCIKVAVNCQSSKLSLPVSYFDDENEEYPFTLGLRYVVQVTSVLRFTKEDREQESDEPLNRLFCHCPLNQHKTATKDKSLGFWFRFFGKPAKFVVTLSLKLLGVSKLTKLLRNTRELRSLALKDDGFLVCSVDVDISNTGFQQNTRKIKNKLKSKDEKSGNQVPHLYSDNSYQEIMKNIIELRNTQQFSELQCYLASVLSSTKDCDVRTAVILEQSIEIARRGILNKAKLRIKDAVDFASKCKNKALLLGRSYVYLSHIHEEDGNLGSAEECLEIARKNIEKFQPCEDTGDLCFQEGIVLMKFAKRMPKFGWKLQDKAILKFNEALLHYQQGITATNMTEKQLNSHAWLAVLGFQCITDYASVVEKAVSVLSQNFDKLSLTTKYLYYLCKAENHCRHSRFNEAMKWLDEAVTMEDEQGIIVESLWTASLRQTLVDIYRTPEHEASIENGTDCSTEWRQGRDDVGYLGDNNS